MILTLRTDAADAEVGLYRPDGSQISYHTWHADRQLAKDLLAVIHDRLEAADAEWEALTGVVIYQGPGSFTGLRIGITVANTLAYAQGIPIVAVREDKWIQTGLSRINNNENDQIVLPHYGAEANITTPRK